MKRLAVAATIAILTAACGGETPGDGGGGREERNDADVTFAQGMIPHHEEAIDMAEIALTSEAAASPEVTRLAEGITEAQTTEIETLRGWLDAWGESEALEMEEGEPHGNMGGDMPSDVVSELRELEGTKFDEAFLKAMVEHHRSAIAMARTEVEQGEYGPAIDMARDIIETQEAEIEEMSALLSQMN